MTKRNVDMEISFQVSLDLGKFTRIDLIWQYHNEYQLSEHQNANAVVFQSQHPKMMTAALTHSPKAISKRNMSRNRQRSRSRNSDHFCRSRLKRACWRGLKSVKVYHTSNNTDYLHTISRSKARLDQAFKNFYVVGIWQIIKESRVLFFSCHLH